MKSLKSKHTTDFPNAKSCLVVKAELWAKFPNSQGSPLFTIPQNLPLPHSLLSEVGIGIGSKVLVYSLIGLADMGQARLFIKCTEFLLPGPYSMPSPDGQLLCAVLKSRLCFQTASLHSFYLDTSNPHIVCSFGLEHWKNTLLKYQWTV